jgi:hypothetical protein
MNWKPQVWKNDEGQWICEWANNDWAFVTFHATWKEAIAEALAASA